MRIDRGFALFALLAGLVAFPLAAGPSQAAVPDDYAYIFLQGRIASPVDTRPVAGVSVRLVAGADVFEAETDQRGVFVFERLPVREYELQVTTADGKVIEAARPIDIESRVRERLVLHLGRGDPAEVLLEPDVEAKRVDVVVPDRPPDWPRFWKQFGAFAGAAILLLLL